MKTPKKHNEPSSIALGDMFLYYDTSVVAAWLHSFSLLLFIFGHICLEWGVILVA